MRLHRLQLAAFGPFPGEIDVDLDLLGADGLFLLHGDTGAGKTTLLDAIAFALFGRVPGARNEAKRLRCDRADTATKTFVRIEATLGGHRVEIVRSPAYLRPKARGTGLTEEKHKVVLRWLDSLPDGAEAQGLTKSEEVGQAVIDLLGMSADQFFQVVLLPQGEFARFLRSDTAEREVLLERLFDTGRFGTIEEWFALARRDSAARLRDRRVHIGQLVARVAEAAETQTGVEDHAIEWLADLRDRLADDSAIAADAASAARTTMAAAEQRLQDISTVAARIRKWRELHDRQRELERSAGERASWRRALLAYSDAGPVIAAAAHVGELAGQTRELQLVVDQRRPVAERLVAPDEDVPKTAVDLRIVGAATREQAGAMAGLILQSREQVRDQAALAGVGRRRRQILRRLADVDDVLAKLPAAVEVLSTGVEVARAAAQRVGGLAERATAAKTLLSAARSVLPLRAEEEHAATFSLAAADEHQRSVDERQRLVERRIAGMAAELAGGLVAGAGCPVCGSVEHPDPAAPAVGAVSPDQIAQAERTEQIAASARQRAIASRQAASVALAEAQALTLGRTLEAASAEFRVASELFSAQAALANDLAPATAKLQSRVSELQGVTAERQVLMASQAGLIGDEARLSAAITERADRLALACAGYPDVAAKRDHLLELAVALDRLAAATENLDSAEVLHSQATTGLVRAIAASPFDDLASARSAASIDQNELARMLRAAEDELTVVEAMLSDPDLCGLEVTADPDVAGARWAAETARSVAEAMVMSAAAWEARREKVSAAAANLLLAWRDLEPLLAADSELAALTDVILGKGQNAKSMSLRTYVLAAKLAQVALAAGERLSAMSGGRYTFVQSREKESRGRSGGLGLDILDAFSGLVRPAKTLSGGESFLASLSLALGLADVVAAEAGGRQLDTIFIDEGFGSLDADTLDMVMGTLDELRAGGRTVGLVSHVDELRQRIPSRLRIRRTPAGSELEISTG